jgi:hypothetical protein
VQEAPIVGRTPYDLLSDQRLSGSLGNFVSALDPIEVIATAAYVVLGIWGKSTGLPMSFWEFIVLLAGYHLVLRPLSDVAIRWAKKSVAIPNGPRQLPSSRE